MEYNSVLNVIAIAGASYIAYDLYKKYKAGRVRPHEVSLTPTNADNPLPSTTDPLLQEQAKLIERIQLHGDQKALDEYFNKFDSDNVWDPDAS